MIGFIDSSRHIQAPVRLVLVNVIIFLLLHLVIAAAVIAGGVDTASTVTVAAHDALDLPLDLHRWLYRPWTIVTHMVMHSGVWHLLVNMLWLWWMGSIFLQFFDRRQLVTLYLLGGVTGAVLALFTSALYPTGTWLVGASAAVAAVMMGIACYRPGYRVSMLIIGDVALKWLVAAIIIIDLLGLGENLAGHIAHLGGALTGVTFGLLIKRGYDITRLHRVTKATGADTSCPTEVELDAVLDKVRRSGFASLSRQERDILKRASSTV